MNAIFDGKRKIIIVVMLERHFSWQAQHLVKFWEIAGAQNVLFLHQSAKSKLGERTGCDVDFSLGSWSERSRNSLRSVFNWSEQFMDFWVHAAGQNFVACNGRFMFEEDN